MSGERAHTSGAYKAAIIAVLAWALIGTVAATTYYTSYDTSIAENRALKDNLKELRGNLTGVQALYAELLARVALVNVYINYGNGTVSSYENVTISNIRATAFIALMSIADVEFQASSFGVFVTSINGVKQSISESQYWLYYVYEKDKGWTSPEVAADRYRLSSGMSISWNFTKIAF